MFASLHTATIATGRVQSAGSTPSVLSFMRAAFAAHRQRQFLARLDDRTLADIGVDRDEAMVEATRPLWDVPPSWISRHLM